MKNLTLIYCGEDGSAGKALAETIRAKDNDNKVVLCSCEFFGGAEPEASHVIIMPDVPEHKAGALREAYPDIVETIASQPVRIYADSADHRATTPFLTESPEPKRGPGRPRKVAA